MKHCEHPQVRTEMVKKEYFGEQFTAKGVVCAECEAILWDSKLQEKFNDWLIRLDASKRDKFTIQFSLTERALECLEHLAKQFPGVNDSQILRALAVIYFNKVAPNPEFARRIESITESDVFKSLLTGEKRRSKVHFKPSALLDIHSWAKIVDLPPSRLLEESILRVFSVYIENDPEMKEFWKANILPDLELILKAS